MATWAKEAEAFLRRIDFQVFGEKKEMTMGLPTNQQEWNDIVFRMQQHIMLATTAMGSSDPSRAIPSLRQAAADMRTAAAFMSELADELEQAEQDGPISLSADDLSAGRQLLEDGDFTGFGEWLAATGWAGSGEMREQLVENLRKLAMVNNKERIFKLFDRNFRVRESP